MPIQTPLSSTKVDQIITYLDYNTITRVGLDCIAGLISAYIRKVPWESASHIVRYAENPTPESRANWPLQFWQDAIEKGTGGTCFESNYAFFALLEALGFEGYLTINNMRDSTGCHTAIVLLIDGQKYLLDAGLPLHTPIRIDADHPTRQPGKFHNYTITPQGNSHYLVERDRHPRPDCFTLIDKPVSDADYRAALLNDYEVHGLFLDRVIVTQVVDERIWRFGAGGIPYHLESFLDEDKNYHLLDEDVAKVAHQVSRHFSMQESVLLKALQLFP